LDFGMYLENVMILARSHGLETCPQAAFSSFHKTIREYIDIADDFIIICGMAIGHADWARAECALITDREPTSNYVTYYDR
ncbi:MAG: nitroreductase family protein, partial [Alphaproteobacteria bacterium]|nr:nitroreductase family protein [Alphaproteobacteria bacterium]